MKKILNKIINSKRLIYLLELVLPTILLILFTVYVDNKKYNSKFDLDYSDTDLITISFGILFYFIVVLEWYRRFKTKDNTIKKYFYITVIFIVFIFGIWFVNSMFSE